MQALRIILLMGMVLAGGCRDESRVETKPLEMYPQNEMLRRQWGIEISSIGLSAAGCMLDFRYRVTDPDLAKPLLGRGVECCLIDQKTGSKLIVPAPPKVGSLRNAALQPVKGKIYYIMFANPGRLIEPDDKITIAVSNLEIRDLTVQ